MTKSTNKPTNELTQSTNKIQFRHAYSPQHKVQLTFNGPGLTKQEFKDESDINNIMARYMKTGLIDNVSQQLPQFAEVDGQTFYDAMLVVAESKTLFQQLPSQVREKFEHDPGKFLDFVHNEENLPEMKEMGLLRPDADLSYLSPTPASTTQPAPAAANVGSGLAEGQT